MEVPMQRLLRDIPTKHKVRTSMAHIHLSYKLSKTIKDVRYTGRLWRQRTHPRCMVKDGGSVYVVVVTQ